MQEVLGAASCFSCGICCVALPRLLCRIYDVAMSFSDTIFLFFLALILFGPKKLPEMARKAGRLMAELRRASNEFRSQIETEIAHLEVEKSQTVLPPTPPPEGVVASLGSTPPAIEAAPHESPDAIAGSAVESSGNANPASAEQVADPVAPSTSAPTEAAAESQAPASQESHV
jgi:sec-independent protein translocase protein TatB